MMVSPFCRMIISIFIFFTITTFFSCLIHVTSQLPLYDYYPTANLSTSWINGVSAIPVDASTVTFILIRESTFGPKYACGFYCNGINCTSYLFATFIFSTLRRTSIPEGLLVLWSANQNNPVRINATLELTPEGDLVLRDADGTLAWSTSTAGRSVAGLNLTETGNLVLFDANNSVVWQSFDHPTDCLVQGQILVAGQNLTASASSTNWTEGVLYSLSMTEQGLVASILSDPPQIYYKNLFGTIKQNKVASYAKFQNGSLDLYINGVEPMNPDISITIPEATSAQYIKLGPDGHLRVFDWDYSWSEVADIFTKYHDECNYPMTCGKHGICSNGQCSCPSGASIRQISYSHPELGCSEVIPLTCNASVNHSFLDLQNVTYFSFIADINNTDMNSCKEACLKTCSCKAAIFHYGSDPSAGDCYLPSQIFSLMYNENYWTGNNSFISIKVQMAPTVTSPTAATGKTGLLGSIIGSTLGVLFVAVVIGTTAFVYRRRRKTEVKEEYLDHVPGMPTRFSFEELATATDNFKKKLGEGGFGSVFEGSLNDGTRVAVKRLDGVGHIKKSFLAEVETIGCIDHINLVKLIGFCAEKSHWLLVYEYMCNGSLDRWIFCRSHETSLGWNYRRKIILDIAKGLAYLHEECRQKIIHLDIKPQNILLDEHYNAKLGDFGLSKLIDRNQSKVVTTMRGTPGYLAPEWLSAVITEKVDVYSFGVVILEILCGRKIFEKSMPEEERYLLTLFKKKAEEEQCLDLVDKYCHDVESNVAQIEEMMQISALCLQNDHQKRPSMSTVIKVLEGVKDVQKVTDFSFLTPQENGAQDVTRILPSVVSGPR